MTTPRASALLLGLVVALVIAFGGGWVSGRTGLFMRVDPATLEARERAFVEQSERRARRVVHDGRASRAAPSRPYEIASVEKVGDRLWRFNARMVHEGMDVTIPIVVPMEWLGDTPVVMLTDYTIPAVGTFTARVFFYGSRYAGTWQHGDGAGGHLFGKIER